MSRQLNGLTREPQPENPLRAGKISQAPATVDDDVYVILEDLPEQPVGPVLGWRSAPEANWPKVGERCAIFTSTDGADWLIGWDR